MNEKNLGIQRLPAIDVLGQYGTWVQDEARRHVGECMSGNAETVVSRAWRANVEWTVVSPLLGLVLRENAERIFPLT